jgi:hypothetical protein
MGGDQVQMQGHVRHFTVALQVFAFRLLSPWPLANLLRHDPIPVWTGPRRSVLLGI